MNVKNARNCEDIENPVIKLINTTCVVDKNCNVFMSSCSQVSSYKTSVVRFSFCLSFLFCYYANSDEFGGDDKRNKNL